LIAKYPAIAGKHQVGMSNQLALSIGGVEYPLPVIGGTATDRRAPSTLELRHDGSTAIKLKQNLNPSRTEFEGVFPDSSIPLWHQWRRW
jgi:hypothetical protein